MDPYRDVEHSYREFASEAVDSPTYARWAAAVADDPEVVRWIATLPGIKQQPNLVFAAARWHKTPAPAPYEILREALLGDDGSIRATILERATQTNEVGRLATLVPALARFHGPLALLEVGASAGLCLQPDRWSYEWLTADGPVRLTPEGAQPDDVLRCEVTGPAPLPESFPKVAWRGGLDLHPLDVTDPDEMAWLAQLVWPEQDERRRRLARAVRLARNDPPRVEQGDLLTELPRMVEEASAHGTVVVFHSAVIAYLTPEDRLVFDEVIRSLVAAGACHWVSNEAPGVLPSVTGTGPAPEADDPPFVLGVDGAMVARTHGHGRSLRWTA